MLLLTHLCGLRIADVVDADDAIRTEIRLDAERTKNNHARTIFVPKQMQRQLKTFLKSARKPFLHGFLFSKQKSQQFSANTVTQHLQRLNARTALQGGTSHSGRRTWLTTLSQKGVSVRVRRRWLDIEVYKQRNAAQMLMTI